MTDQPQFLTLVDGRFFQEQSGSHRIALGYRPDNLDALPQISVAIFFRLDTRLGILEPESP